MADDIEIYQTGNWPEVPPTIQVGHGTRAGDGIKIWDLENKIYFKDATVLADTIAALGSNHVLMSPAKARQLLGISTSAPFISATGQFDPANTIFIDYPMNRTHIYDPPIGGEWQVQRVPIATAGLPFGFNPNDIPFLDETHDWFIVNGWTSVATIIPYPPYRFQWSFLLLQYGGAYYNPDTAPPAPAPISTRRWIEGFEWFPDGAGGSGGVQISRDSSRHIDGYGACIRNSTNTDWLHAPTDFGAPTTKNSWERGYVRLRRLPTSDGMGNTFWQINGNLSPSNFNNLRVNIVGQLELCTTVAVLATTPSTLQIDEWVKLDIFLNYSSGAGGTFQLYMNRVLEIDLSGIGSNGLGQNQNHIATRLGAPDTSGARGLELDMDDWVNADIPAALTGMDWLMGSRIMQIRATAQGALTTPGSWSGDFRSTIGNPILSTNPVMSTAVQQSILQFETDWHDQQLSEAPPATTPTGAAWLFQNGCAAAVLGWFCQGVGAGHVFRIRGLGGAVIGTNTLAVGAQAFYGAMYRPVGMVTPTLQEPVTMEWETPAVAGTNQVYGAGVQAEDLGIFGLEDLDPTVSPLPPTPPQYAGIHNAPYPRSQWALIGGMPQSSVFVAYGVYTGNGTGADLNLPYPPSWLYVRPVTPAGADGVRWWSSQLTAHNGLNPGIASGHMPQALEDPAFQSGIGNSLSRRSGTSASANANLGTFQYVAFCDPGQRFVTNGAFSTPSSIASAIQFMEALGAFTPEAGFFNVEQVGTLITTDWWYKGIGHAAANASRMNAAETANVVTFGTGQITSQTPLHLSGGGGRPQTSYSLWRQNDTISAGPSQGVVLALATYTGDGTASRVIPLALGGRFPCFALVTPHNGTSFVRDPSHTGTTSSQMPALATTSATAITAGGINSITVGITLNANGIVYDVFVIPSCSQTGWDNNGGDYCPLNFGGYTAAPPEPYEAGIPVEGTPDLCVNDWDTPRADGLPYVPLMPGSEQDENQ